MGQPVESRFKKEHICGLICRTLAEQVLYIYKDIK